MSGCREAKTDVFSLAHAGRMRLSQVQALTLRNASTKCAPRTASPCPSNLIARTLRLLASRRHRHFGGIILVEIRFRVFPVISDKSHFNTRWPEILTRNRVNLTPRPRMWHHPSPACYTPSILHQLLKSAEHFEKAANMDSFKQLMTAMGVYHQGIDFIRELPVELSQIILSKLDTRSLLNAAQVSRKWLAISKSTSSLRQRVRRHIRRRTRKLAQVLPPPPSKQSSTRVLHKPMPYIPQTKIPYPTILDTFKRPTSKYTQTKKLLRL
ncbi:hypothetical protein TSAR_008509 [Trichomalopsis sarcophagae]|uniref:F-box domain-containing protein n=1 Tax=Trichomalopsis sarcophagae TaxID=543379 RepID=A0A232F3H6_9HYME|nr:hypothetical protein TSAR_008509 [Trichomalopsis sarcophagae]